MVCDRPRNGECNVKPSEHLYTDCTASSECIDSERSEQCNNLITEQLCRAMMSNDVPMQSTLNEGLMTRRRRLSSLWYNWRNAGIVFIWMIDESVKDGIDDPEEPESKECDPLGSDAAGMSIGTTQ